MKHRRLFYNLEAQKDARLWKLDYAKPVDKGPHRTVLVIGWAC